MEKIRTDDLCLNGLKIKQFENGYAFTSDSVLLANFVKAKKTDCCLEIGTGSGVISVLVNHKQTPQNILAIEIQKKYCELAQKNFCENNMPNITSKNISLQDFANSNKGQQFDVIFSNPPFFKDEAVFKNKNYERDISRHESFLPLESFVKCTSKLLKFGGKFFFIYSSNRLAEVLEMLCKHNLQPKRLCLVYPNQKKESSVFLCEATLGGKVGLRVLSPLFTNSLSGEYVETLQKLFGTKKQEKV